MLKFFNQYYTVRSLIFFLVETSIIFFGIWATMYLVYQGHIPEEPFRASIYVRILTITLIIQISLYYHDLYAFDSQYKTIELSLRILQSIGVACLILAAVYFLFPFLILKQGIFFIGLFFLLVSLVSWRLIYQHLCHKSLFNEGIILIGDGNLASLINQEIENNLDSGYKISAVFSNPGNNILTDHIQAEHYSNYDQICQVAIQQGIKKIVVSLEERRGKYPIRPLLACKMMGMKILDGLSFYEILSGKIIATHTPPSWLIFSEGFNRQKLALVSKKIIDMLLAFTGLIMTSPLMAIIAIAVKLSSSGPIFFKQDRVGQRENLIKVIKFRTMKENAEENSGAIWAQEDDPRITKVGHVLRKFRLDELPQFWNVFKGEMSFVGPRPERPEFVEQLKKELPYYGERHTVKPGITGWAQIKYGYGASQEDALRKLEYDLFYIKHLSLLFDLFIVLKTIKIVLFGSGSR